VTAELAAGGKRRVDKAGPGSNVRYLDYYHGLLMERFISKRMPAPQGVLSFRVMLGAALGSAPSWIILFLVSGGYDLPAYLTEQRRLLEARRQREFSTLRTEKTEAAMQLAVLQAQIEPHFLFNTLASVRSIILTEPERAVASVATAKGGGVCSTIAIPAPA